MILKFIFSDFSKLNGGILKKLIIPSEDAVTNFDSAKIFICNFENDIVNI